MEYKRFDTKLLVRLDPGDELVASLIDICKKEDIRLGVVSGIGAVNNVTVGLFKTSDQGVSRRDAGRRLRDNLPDGQCVQDGRRGLSAPARHPLGHRAQGLRRAPEQGPGERHGGNLD